LGASRRLTAYLGFLAPLLLAGSIAADSGIVAMSGATLHLEPPSSLIPFEGGQAVLLATHFTALTQHAADDDDVVLLLLETGSVRTADESLASVVLYAEDGIGREVSKLLRDRGDVLLFETAPGSEDPQSADRVRWAGASGDGITFYADPGFTPVPEPGRLPSFIAGALLLAVLARRRRDAPRTIGRRS
jgi:hypothetical protein